MGQNRKKTREMADSDQTKESKSGAPPGPDSDLKSATGSDPEDQETFKNKIETGSSAVQEDQNKNLVKLKIIQKNLVKLRRKKKKKTTLTIKQQQYQQHQVSMKPQ